MKKTILSLAALAFCAPLWASAAEGFVVADISLQAGPDTQYPSIEELYAGTNVEIQGCLQGWTWCDVIASNGDRGWVPGTFIEETYNNQRVVVIDYGARIGVPIVSFSIGTYWDHYYQSRPFYAQRTQWQSRAIRVRAPSRPANVATISHPTDTRTQTQEPRATTGTTQQHTTAPAPTAAPERTTTERSSNEPRTAKLAHPESRPVPEPQAKPESAPAPAKPTDMPERMKPVEHPVQPTQAAKPMASAKQKDDQKAHEPKPKDELKPEKKKDDGGKKDEGGDGGGR
jgi:uncharacterized protein YraI